MNKKFYITTAIDYTNEPVHIGHSYQKILSDAIARYHRLLGEETYFLTGTDEHGQKVEKSAKEHGVEPKRYVDEIAAIDKKEWDNLNIAYDRFIRTTDEDHVEFASQLYLKSKAAGDIYLDKYNGLYCEGCEAYLTESDLVDGKCPVHPNRTPIHIQEENYFFRLSKYQKFLEELVENNERFVIPEGKRKEILAFIKGGLKDFAVSRPTIKWGIPVPDDPKQTIYVWFDALINYLTYGVEKNCWPADVHVLGKDNQRFHAIYWPAMLKSAGYELPKTILVHDFITLNNQKISKSLGNVITPSELIKKFGVDGTRYFFLRYGPLNNDVDITLDRIKEIFNADLANGLGNLVARVIALAVKNCDGRIPEFKQNIDDHHLKVEEVKLWKLLDQAFSEYKINFALDQIWQFISLCDQYIDKTEPWRLAKDNKQKFDEVIYVLLDSLKDIAWLIYPFMPETAKMIGQKLNVQGILAKNPVYKDSWKKISPGDKIETGSNLFPRI